MLRQDPSARKGRVRMFGPEPEPGGRFSARGLPCPHALPFSGNLQAKTDPRRVKKSLRIRFGGFGEIFDRCEPQIPTLVQIGVLRVLPDLIQRGPDRKFDIDAFGIHHFLSIDQPVCEAERVRDGLDPLDLFSAQQLPPAEKPVFDVLPSQVEWLFTASARRPDHS